MLYWSLGNPKVLMALRAMIAHIWIDMCCGLGFTLWKECGRKKIYHFSSSAPEIGIVFLKICSRHLDNSAAWFQLMFLGGILKWFKIEINQIIPKYGFMLCLNGGQKEFHGDFECVEEERILFFCFVLNLSMVFYFLLLFKLIFDDC